MKTPIYLEIVEYLKKLIHDSRYAPGNNPIPKEVDLCTQFRVSRETMRKSIQILVNEGYLYRIKKSGTFVNSNRIKNKVSLIEWTTYHQDNLNENKKINSFLKKISVVPLIKVMAFEFGVDENGNHIKLERVLGKGDAPEVYFKSYFNPCFDFFFQKDFLDFKWESLYDFIESKGIKLSKSEEFISAKRLDENLITLLKIKDDTTPIIKRERRVYTSDGKLIEINYGYYNADKVKYQILITK